MKRRCERALSHRLAMFVVIAPFHHRGRGSHYPHGERIDLMSHMPCEGYGTTKIDTDATEGWDFLGMTALRLMSAVAVDAEERLKVDVGFVDGCRQLGA